MSGEIQNQINPRTELTQAERLQLDSEIRNKDATGLHTELQQILKADPTKYAAVLSEFQSLGARPEDLGFPSSDLFDLEGLTGPRPDKGVS